MDNNYNYYLKQIKGENGQVKQTKTDAKKQVHLMTCEKHALSDECKNLETKKQAFSKEKSEMKFVIDSLKEELGNLDEQLLRINLKINQTQNEYSRLDEEL